MDVFVALSLLSLALNRISRFIHGLSCLLRGLRFCCCMCGLLTDLRDSPCILLSDGLLKATLRCLRELIY